MIAVWWNLSWHRENESPVPVITPSDGSEICLVYIRWHEVSFGFLKSRARPAMQGLVHSFVTKTIRGLA